MLTDGLLVITPQLMVKGAKNGQNYHCKNYAQKRYKEDFGKIT